MKSKCINNCLDMTEFGWYAHPTDTWRGYIEFDKVKCIKLLFRDYHYYVVIYYGIDDSYIRCSEEFTNSKLATKALEHIIEVNEERLMTKYNIELV